MQFVDLHIHSKYSRACSQNISLESLSANARLKGLTVLGTGDFSHPVWNKELKAKLSENNGVYEYNGIKFILSNEISLIYKQGMKQRRVHHLLLAPDLGVVDQITEFLLKKGRVDYDGRPIFGFSSIELVEAMMGISRDIMVIPAHAWTPWYGIFGSMSGFDSLQECFQEKTKHIHAIETGLSSDPAMNWRLSSLDNVALVSFSDAHSDAPHRLGRECCAIDVADATYRSITDAIQQRKLHSTVEFFPEEGKYHYDGHRACSFSCTPEESRRLGNRCPRCSGALTIGVLHRVEELADRPAGFTPEGAAPFTSLVPLSELIAAAYRSTVYTQKVRDAYGLLIRHFGTELHVLLSAERSELVKCTDEKIADAIIMNREGTLRIVPGYDGVYGKILLDGEQRAAPQQHLAAQRTVRQFF